MKPKKRKFKRSKRGRQTMLGTFSNKLDKNTSIISVIIISLITLSIASSGLFGVFNISGVFKQ
ncbi:MAG: hypothetical protein A3I68_01550 [Candidatus Melainabacteria bacterium RIFCSPLOWO2_02_FULL_35_15]|nr:MAG: hypothetical protein A3F80_04860 [Candidatus Melainabacteria bacterium RIFCSPLOWO2_12_FULL_35_11]OGI12996.1 MAG: hypothetical protein A3I68_01550 [Candidatus Melainabacteria bacterium RIFCSPLOWO2_02_FULL_35_15]